MMVKYSAKELLLRNISNIPGWRTKRHLVVIESDDWGSVRMPSREVFDNLIRDGIDLLSDEGYRYNKYDSLATSEDLTLLFEVLTSVKDSTGRPAVFTPVSVVANPDFDKIEQSDFSDYFYEPFTNTLKRYPDCEKSFTIWKEGIKSRLFVPQFHGREHLNVKVWMRALKKRDDKTIKAFINKTWGISTANDPEINVEFQAAFDFIDPDDLKYQKEVIISGLHLFQELFGYHATYFVPPNGPFSSKLEPVCSGAGIRYLSVSKIQDEPQGEGRPKKSLHWPGQKNKTGLTYITRNCFFEPGQPGQDWNDSCLSEISTAFMWRKPAIICSHRVNYIGALYEDNRKNGLAQLSLLLRSIMKSWPDTEFITSAELGEIISNG
jgi:hypothetical protein